MASTMLHHDLAISADDYGLGAVARHNATADTEEFPPYDEENARSLETYRDTYLPADSQSSFPHNPPTPHSATNTETEEGVRTRSGRSTRARTDSPFSASKSRVSKSPVAPTTRMKRAKKSNAVLDKAKSQTPKLTAPLSVLTKDMDVPVKDMDAWVHRPASVRREEVEQRNGYVTRPMNSFMLYRSAYAERTKQWATQNNHQVVSSVAGESWPMEPEEVRNQFNEWARIERANHAAAHPEYKFSPSKVTKKRKGDFSDDEDDGSDLDGDPDGEYHVGGRSTRRRRHQQQQPDLNEAAYFQGPVGFGSHPYYGQQPVYDMQQYPFAQPGRTHPSNASYEASGIAYNPQTGTYVQTAVQQHPSYGYVPQADFRIQTPNSQHGGQTLGGYGLPGGQNQMHTAEDFFVNSRTGTPAMNQHYDQYYQHYAPAYNPPTPQNVYEHQQYLQNATQIIDPGLDEFNAGDNHFDEAIAEMAASGMPEYFEENTSPNQTLAPRWEASVADFEGGVIR